MPLPQSVVDHYASQRRLEAAALALVQREWATMGEDLDLGWARVGPRVALLTAAAQLGAARDGAAYVPQSLAEQRIRIPAEAATVPAAFAGIASSMDGFTYGSLDDLLYGAVVHARAADAGSLAERLDVGAAQLRTLVQTQVADAARMSAAATITATPRVGWVRLVSSPTCQRCAVLAGKFFRSDEGFLRHPRCRCRHTPTSESRAGSLTADPGPDDVRDLTKAQRRAIADGADVGQVINAHRVGARSKDLMTTSAGGPKGKRRLTPKGIYHVSADRGEALRRLIEHGYLR